MDYLNVIHVKLDDDSLYFVGAFKNFDADRYVFENKRQYKGKTSFTRPFGLPESYLTFFDQYECCDGCEIYDVDVSRSLYLVKENHGDTADNKFHFDCVLPTLEDAENYVRNTGYGDQYTITHLKVPYDKNDFFLRINNNMVQAERDKAERDRNSKSWQKEDRKKSLDMNNQVNDNNTLLKVAIGLLLVDILLGLYDKIFT